MLAIKSTRMRLRRLKRHDPQACRLLVVDQVKKMMTEDPSNLILMARG